MRNGLLDRARRAAAFAAAPLWLPAAMAVVLGVSMGAAPGARAQTSIDCALPAHLPGRPTATGVPDRTNTVCVFPVPPDWALVPDGIGRGDSFRLLAVSRGGGTSGRWATHAPYDLDIRNDVTLNGHSAVRAYASGFRSLVSTSSTNATTHTQTNSAADRAEKYAINIPVYWLNGSRIAANYADMYDGAWENESRANWRNTSGTAAGFGTTLEPWTGSQHDGTAAGVQALGGPGTGGTIRMVRHGSFDSDANLSSIIPNGGTASPLSGGIANRLSLRPIMMLSPVFRVSNAVAVNLSVSAVGETAGSSVTVTEGAANATMVTITATLESANNTGSALSIPVRVRAAGTTATAADDYTFGSDNMTAAISIADGSAQGTAVLAVVDDTTAESEDETVTVELGSVPSDARDIWSRGPQASVRIVIRDDDVNPRIFVGVKATISEGDGDPAGFFIYSQRPLITDEDANLSVNLEVSDFVYSFTGGAMSPYNYGYVAAGEPASPTVTMATAADAAAAREVCTGLGDGYTIPDNAYNCATHEVAISNDQMDEPDAAVRVAVISGTGYRGGTAGAVTVRDDDATVLKLSPSPPGPSTAAISLTEGVGEATMKLSVGRPLAPGEVLTVPLDFTGDAMSTGPGRDYTLKCASPGAGVSCTADLGGGGAGVPLARGAGIIVIEGHVRQGSRIIDTAIDAELTLSAEPDRSDEDPEDMMVGIGRSSLVAGLGESATMPALSITVDRNNNNMNDDTLAYSIVDHPANALTLSVSSTGGGLTEGGAGSATLTATLANGNETGKDILIPILVRAHGDPADAENAEEYKRAATAAQPADYTLAAASIRIAAGAASGTVGFMVTDDSLDEPDETVTVEVDEDELPALGNVQVTGNGGYDTFVIGDDDPTPVELSVSDRAADEGDSSDNAGIDIALGRGLGWSLERMPDKTLACAPETLRATLGFMGGAFGADEDFTLTLPIRTGSPGGVALDTADPRVVVFGLGAPCAARVGAPRVTDDLAVVELVPSQDADLDDETIEVSIGSLAPGHLDGGVEEEAAAGDLTIIILDEDQPVASFARGGTVIGHDEERPGTVNLELRLSPAPIRDVRVGYTVAGAAAAGTDFELAGLSGGAGYVEVGARAGDESAVSKSAAIMVTFHGDDIAEGDEELTLTLFSGSDYELADVAGTHTVTIRIDDDDTAGVAVVPAGFQTDGNPLRLTEGGAPGCYTLKLTSDPVARVTILPHSGDLGAAAAEVVATGSDAACDAEGKLTGGPGDDMRFLEDRAVFTGGDCAAGDSDSEGDWCMPRIVRVSPKNDDDGAPENVRIDHTVLGYHQVLGDEDRPVTFEDIRVRVADDEPTACFSATGAARPVLTPRGACDPETAKDGAAESAGPSAVSARIYLLKRAPGGAATEPATAPEDIELRYNVSGSASWGSDYTIGGGGVTFDERASAGTVTLASGGAHADIEVTIVDDETRDPGEDVILTLAGGPGYVLGGNTFRLTITDNDTAGLVLAGHPLRLREGAEPACYDLSLATDPGATVTVRPESSNPGVAAVAAIGAAMCGDERAPVSDRLVFSGGDCATGDGDSEGNWCRPQKVRVSSRGDADSAQDEVRINHVVRGYAGIETIPQVNAIIVNRIEADFGDATESTVGEECPAPSNGNGAAGCGTGMRHEAEVRIRLTRAPESDEDPFGIGFLAGGSAAPGRDYAIAPGAMGCGGGEPESPVCFDPATGAGSVRIDARSVRTDSGGNHYAVIPVEILHDDIVEGDETVILGLTGGADYTLGTAAVHTLTIGDDDGGPGVTVTPTSLRLVEGGANGAYTVVLNTDPEGEVAVVVDTGNVDSVTVSTDVLAFTSGNWDVPQTVAVSALDDPDGADERATLFHTVAGYGDVATAPAVEVTVADDDDDLADTVVSIVAGPAIAEGGLAEFTVSATPLPEDALTVNVTVADSGDFARSGQAGRRPVTIGSDGTARLTVATVDDGEDEPDGRIEATVEPGRGYTVASSPSDSATVPVADGDDPTSIPRAAFTAPSALVAEGARVHEVIVAIDPPPESSIALNYILGGEAAPEADYVIAGAVDGAGAIAVAAGAATAAIPVIVVEDSLVEGDEALTLTLAAGRGYEVGGVNVHTLVLVDDDSAGVTVSERSLSVAEGGANSAYTVVLGTDPGGAVTVTPFLDDPGAAAVSGSLSFTSDNWRTPQTVLVSALDDADADNETVTVSHRVSGYPGIVSAPDVVLTVIDDDVDLGDPVVSIAAGGAIEEGGLASFTLRAEPPPRVPFAVNVTVADGGGFAAVGQAGSRPVSIGAAGSATLTVATVDDVFEEADGALTATVVPGAGYEAADWPDNQAVVEVADNDGPPVVPEVMFTASSAEAGEGSGAHVVTIGIEPAIEAPLTLAYTLAGTAAQGTDFTVAGAAGPGGTVDAAPGAVSVAIEVTIADDGVNEPSETVVLILSPDSAYSVAAGGGAHTLTIADDDAAAGLQAQAAPALARLGRSLAEQLMLGVDGRLASRRRQSAERAPGGAFSATFAGRSDWLDPEAGWRLAAAGGGTAAGFGESASGGAGGLASLGPGSAARHAREGAASGALRGTGFEPRARAPAPGRRGARFEDLLRRAVAGSSFLGSGPQIGGGALGIWGRGATAGFSGASEDFTLDGSMTSVQLGADWTGVWLTAGVMLAQGDGEGRYRQGGVEGDVELALSSIVPYLGYQLGERVSLWSALSVSVGDLALIHAGDEAVTMDLSMRAAAAGVRGEVYRGGGAFTLSVVSDVFAVDAETEPLPGLPDVRSGASRLRLAAEGVWTRGLPFGGRLSNRTELGLRADGGDAEEGVGLELANATSLAGNGLTAELEGRRLLLHADEGFSQYGVSFHLAWDPMPRSPAGPVASLRRAWGIGAASGVARLYRMSSLAGFGPAGPDAGRASLEVGWGVLWLRDLYVLTPTLTGAAAGGARETGVAVRLAPSRHNGVDLSAGLGATWRGPAGDRGGAAAELGFRLRW